MSNYIDIAASPIMMQLAELLLMLINIANR